MINDLVQDFTNPFLNINRNDPYMIIAAGEGFGEITFPDGSTITSIDLKLKLGYSQLFAWNLESKALLSYIQKLKNNPNTQSRLVVDSGAYSAWSRGLNFDIDEYINYLNSNDVIETCFWCAEADVIPGSNGKAPTKQEIEEAPYKSWDNYLYMIKHVKIPKKIVPIFHQGEDFIHLKTMLEYTFPDGDHIPYIGISPSNLETTKGKVAWYEKVTNIIRNSSNPNVLTHNFGMTSISIMEQFPSFSSDSTSWIRSASFGSLLIPYNGKTITIVASDRKYADKDHILYANPEVKSYIKGICDRIGHGVTIQTLIESSDMRKVFNLYSLNDWRCNFKFEGRSNYKKSLWEV